MKIIKILFVLALFLISSNATAKDKIQSKKVDSEFEQFWKEFQGAVTKADKNKAADLTYFPLHGDIEYLYDADNGKSYKNDRNSFLKHAFKNFFNKGIIRFFSNVKNLQSGSLGKNVKYKFTNIKVLAKKGNLPDFLNNSVIGYEFQIYDNSTPEGEFNAIYYFIKISGKYKFYGYVIFG